MAIHNPRETFAYSHTPYEKELTKSEIFLKDHFEKIANKNKPRFRDFEDVFDEGVIDGIKINCDKVRRSMGIWRGILSLS